MEKQVILYRRYVHVSLWDTKKNKATPLPIPELKHNLIPAEYVSELHRVIYLRLRKNAQENRIQFSRRVSLHDEYCYYPVSLDVFKDPDVRATRVDQTLEQIFKEEKKA